MEEVSGLTTEELLEDIARTKPPERLEGLGVTIGEVRKRLKCGRDAALKYLEELVPVEMSGTRTPVYMPKKQAEQYKEWIIKE